MFLVFFETGSQADLELMTLCLQSAVIIRCVPWQKRGFSMLSQSLSGAHDYPEVSEAFPPHLIHEEPFTLRSGVIAQGFSKGQGPESFHRNSISESYGLVLCLGHPGPRDGQLVLGAGNAEPKTLAETARVPGCSTPLNGWIFMKCLSHAQHGPLN